VTVREDLGRLLRDETGDVPRWWSNGPGDRYGWHLHPYHKVLFCAEGSIAFHLRDRDVALTSGDRLDIEPGTEHAATVGSEGVTCVEAARPS
jgi:quercetin dioxygenase-like cupin family protein